MKRAAIYIRVSSEKQSKGAGREGENKASPQMQEQDGRDYCQNRGYHIVGVYSDTEKYRAGKKLVEPSGMRNDRPQFRRMIADVDAGLVDVIVAWREDRLYRGVTRAMLEISERVSRKAVEVELVKEYYDSGTAVVKAWAAGVELQAKHDRLMMGVAARLTKGKAWNGHKVYGYDVIDGDYVINEIEASWVHKIFTWFAEGETGKTIRTRLVTGGAPQKEGIRVPWPVQRLYHMARKECYWTGILPHKWDGEVYEIPIPPIIEPDLAAQVKARLDSYKAYPAGNLKEKALAAGLAYCQTCGTRMIIHRTNGSIYYECTRMVHIAEKPEDCAGTRSIRILDAELWEKIWEIISKPGRLEQALETRIQQLQEQEIDARWDIERLESELETLILERQKVVTWARKSLITEADLKIQIEALGMQEHELRRELDDKYLLTKGDADRLRELSETFRNRILIGYEGVMSEPASEEEAKQQFKAKRKLVNALVDRVEVAPDKSIQVYFAFGIPGENISISPTCRRWSERFQPGRHWYSFLCWQTW